MCVCVCMYACLYVCMCVCNLKIRRLTCGNKWLTLKLGFNLLRVL